YGGRGGNVFTVADTTSVPVTVHTGFLGNNEVDVQQTHGALNIHGQGGRDRVTIGNQGNPQAIGGTVTITNSLGFTDVTVDDSADAASRSVTLDTFTPTGDREYGRVRGLASA